MMGGKQVISYFVTTLFVLAVFKVLPTNGDIISPWSDKKMESDLMNCVYIKMVTLPQLFSMPLQAIDDIKWKLLADSDSIVGMSYVDKKVAMDDKFGNAMANAIKQTPYKSNPAIIDVVSEAAGNCYSSVTGYDPSVIIQDIKSQVKDLVEKNPTPLGGDPNPAPNPANQNQQSNFQPSQQVQSPYVNDAPFNPPGLSPANSFNNPSNVNGAPFNTPGLPPAKPYNNPQYGNGAPFNPPGSPPTNSFNNPPYGNNDNFNSPGSPPTNSFNNPPYGNNDNFNSPGSPPINSFNNPAYGNDAPFNAPGSQPINSFNNPPYGNNDNLNPPGSPPINSFNNPEYGNDDPFNPPGFPPVNSFNNPPYVNDDDDDYYYDPASPPVNPSNNPAFVNNDEGPSESDEGQGETGIDYSQYQAPSDSSSGSSFQNDNESFTRDSPDNTAFETTTSSRSSSQSQTSKPPKSDISNWTTPSPNTNVPQKTTNGNEMPEDKVPCDEKFRNALFEKLKNDERFSSIFGKLPVSSNKATVPKIMNRAFTKYGIQQHYKEFETLWKFDSKTLKKESDVDDWDEVISKICKIIFSRNNLLKGDCEEIGIEIADYILQVLPGDPPTTTTQAPNQNDGNDNASTESNASSASHSATSASPENKSNSGNSSDASNLSFPELHSKIADMFNNEGTAEQDSDTVPFSETLSAFEANQNLESLHSSAESCLSPSGFDFEKFMGTMSNVTDSIQKNHPDWSPDKCQSEMYSAAVAVMAELLQETAKSSNNNAPSQSSSDQSDSSTDSSASESSESEVPNDYYSDSDDSTYPDTGTDYDSDSAPQAQQDFSNYSDYPDEPEPANVPPYQPGPGNWNSGLAQPTNFAPSPVGANYGNSQNTPPLAKQPYDYNYGSQDYGPPVPQPMPQNVPSPDYYAIPPVSKNIQPYSGIQPFPGNQNTGFQKPPSNPGFVNSPNRNNQFQPSNFGNNYAAQPVANPVLPNSNSQSFQQQPNLDYGAASGGSAMANGNTQPGFNSNYNPGFPVNGQAGPQW